jgi:pimeloyl-ACP methyl ester carboxylesterase
VSQANGFVLFHGAGLGPWIWDEVIPRLGVPARAVPRGDPRTFTLEGHVQEVALELGSLRPAVLVGHSIGAEIALVLAASRPYDVAAVVLVGGMVPVDGRSFLSLMPLPMRLTVGTLIRLSRSGVRLPSRLVEKAYCNDLDTETTAKVLGRLEREPRRLYLDPVRWAGLPTGLPRYYLKLSKDASASQAEQDVMIQRTGAKVTVLDTGHLPMMSRPGELAEALEHIREQLGG